MSTRFYSLISLAALSAGVVFAAKACQIVPVVFPSVDADGNPSQDNTGEGQGKLCINTNNGKVLVKAAGQTPNESGAKQNYKDDPGVNAQYDGLFLSRSRFKVAVNGACKLQLKGTIVN